MAKTTEAGSELVVVTKSKDLLEYVLTVTQKSPKQFRFTLVSRMQNLAIDVVEQLYRANEVFVGGDAPGTNLRQRLDMQHQAITDLKLLCYLAEIAMRQGCLIKRQYELIAQQSSGCRNLIGAWITSDRKRFPPKPAPAGYGC
jgi:hypothetical protein